MTLVTAKQFAEQFNVQIGECHIKGKFETFMQDSIIWVNKQRVLVDSINTTTKTISYTYAGEVHTASFNQIQQVEIL